jgi:isopentenyl diphosphate isomerase/L-lactate dehydrogenase-like FMN-dependent dehydrogenase
VPRLPGPVEAYNIADLREHARRVLPRGLFEFVDRGTEDEHGLAANRAAFERVRFRPNVLVDISKRSTATTLFGQPASMPVVVAPTGAAGLLWLDGEIAVARAAKQAGIPFTLSTASIVSMERVAAEAGGRLWFQLYMWPDREMSYRLVDRVKAAGYEALMVTVDTAATPNREYNPRNGFSLPMRISRRNAVDVALHPRWFLNVFARYLMRSGIPMLENYPDELRAKLTADPRRKGGLPKNDSLDWSDLRDLRRRWSGPLMIKGILHPDDAARAVDCGVDAVIVSNHGGRNLDAASATLDALPAVVDRVGGRCDVLLDSGVRRGSDVAKAVALGARAVMVGRAPLYGVAAAGETGAGQALHFIHEELLRVMGFLGCNAIQDLGARILDADPRSMAAHAPAEPVRALRPIGEPAAASASVHVLAAGKPA